MRRMGLSIAFSRNGTATVMPDRRSLNSHKIKAFSLSEPNRRIPSMRYVLPLHANVG